MMFNNSSETEDLLRRAGSGDDGAIGSLFERYRRRVRRMVAARIDRRLSARVDPSDVVQEALADAGRRLPEYLREQQVSFFQWLRQLALQRLGWCRRFHLGSRRRSVAREGNLVRPSEESAGPLVDRLEASGSSPSGALVRDEECEQVRAALKRLEGLDRMLLELRYVEQRSFAEIAVELGIGLSAVKMRHLRALKRFRGLVQGSGAEGAS